MKEPIQPLVGLPVSVIKLRASTIKRRKREFILEIFRFLENKYLAEEGFKEVYFI